MNKIYKILVIMFVLSVVIHIASATENKGYTCVDKEAFKSPPPIDISIGDKNIDKRPEPLCPEGKVPKSTDIEKDITKEIDRKIIDQSLQEGPSCRYNYCSNYARSVQIVDNYGVSAYLTQHNPEVKSVGLQSKAWISVVDNTNLNLVAIGWRKGRYDTAPRLHVFSWNNGVPTDYLGWRSYSNYYYPGMTISSNGDAKYYMIKYYNGDWWMAYDGVWIGYYEGTIFNIPFDKGTSILYTGEVMNEQINFICVGCFDTDMGNGLWASNPNAAKIYNQQYLAGSPDTFFRWFNAQTAKDTTSPSSYSVQATGSNSMRYGGPGTGGSSITPSITIDSPNGGEKLIRGTPTTISAYSIKWRYNGQPGPNVRIDLYKGNVLNKVITSSISIGSEGLGYYVWGVPYTQTLGSDYKIKITSNSNSLYSDWSNNYFTISDGNYIIVTSPNGGESWQRGTTKTITWTKNGNTGSYIKIELYKGGVFNKVISSSTPNDGSYSWYVPYIQTGSDYKIKMTSTSNSLYNDWGNNYFKIY